MKTYSRSFKGMIPYVFISAEGFTCVSFQTAVVATAEMLSVAVEVLGIQADDVYSYEFENDGGFTEKRFKSKLFEQKFDEENPKLFQIGSFDHEEPGAEISRPAAHSFPRAGTKGTVLLERDDYEYPGH